MKYKEKCIICNGSDFKYLFTVSNKIIEECCSCGLTKTKNFVAPNYDKYHRDNEYLESEKFFRNFFETRYAIISKFHPQIGDVLDIGAATGTMLDVFKSHGWRTFGVEPSSSYDIAKRKGHDMIHSTLKNGINKGRKYDVIVVNHVLEHIEAADGFLLICKKMLKLGGILYVDVPNFDSLSSKLAGKRWKYILPNEHVYHFTPNTLSVLLENVGFKVREIDTRSGIFEAKNPIRYLIHELLGLKKNFFFDVLGIPGNIISTSLNRGSSMGIIACEK